jgi:uncharacterized membrane protein
MATTSERRAAGGSRRPSQPRRSGAARPAAGTTRKAAGKTTGNATEKAAGKTAVKAAGKTAVKAAGKTAAKTAGKAASRAVEPRRSPAPSKLARKAALKAATTLGRRALESGAESIHRAVELMSDRGSGAITASLHRRIPIQRSVDVAVPLAVAWQEWTSLEALPEGVDRVEDIEPDGDGRLIGRIAGGGAKWEAEILDEREGQSFAWRSVKGSDVAGLVTFHELSPRLTRIELSLDIVPTGAADAVAVASRLADHRAEADLRRLKARLELINPDVYEDAGTTDQ